MVLFMTHRPKSGQNGKVSPDVHPPHQLYRSVLAIPPYALPRSKLLVGEVLWDEDRARVTCMELVPAAWALVYK